MKKIFIVLETSMNPNGGGVQRVSYILGKHFVESLNHSVSFLSLSYEENQKFDFADVYHVLEPGGDSNKNNIEYVENTIQKYQPDIVINQMPYLPNLRKCLYQCKYHYNFLLIACLHNTLLSYYNNTEHKLRLRFEGTMFLRLINSYTVKLAKFIHVLKHRKQLEEILSKNDHFILLSPTIIDELKFYVKDVDLNKIRVIPNPVDTSHQKPTGELQKENVLLYVGRICNDQKRTDLILPVWEKLHKDFPNWKLYIVGSGSYLEKMKSIATGLNLTNIYFEGNQEPFEYYKKAKVFIKTSAYEGFPMVILEALQFGVVPVTFYSYSTIGWVLEHGKNGYLIEPFDVDGMAMQIRELFQNQDQIVEISKTCIQESNRFDIGKITKKWQALFAEFEQYPFKMTSSF